MCILSFEKKMQEKHKTYLKIKQDGRAIHYMSDIPELYVLVT